MRGASKFASMGLTGLAVVTIAGCSRPPLDPRTQDRLVEVAMVGSGPVSGRSVTGVVRARIQSDIGFRVGGKVVQRLVDPGETVHRGQPLMRIDTTDYALALDAARARSIQAMADEARYRDLVAAGAVSASTYDQIRAAAETARAQTKVAEDEARYGVLLADADGVVIETLAEPGQVVTAGQVVVRLAHEGPREADVSLPETIRPAIGSIAKASLYGGSNEEGATARLRQLSASADLQTRTYDARYVLEGKAARAPLGSTVTLNLPDGHAAPAMEIPIAAIIDRGRGPGVWVVGGREPILSWRPVRLAGVSSESAMVAGGLNAGEQFVALGAQLLHAGQRVRVAPTKAAAQ